MVTDLRVSWKRPVVSVVATSLLGLSLLAPSALADSPTRGPAQEVGSKSAGAPSKRSGPARSPAQGPMNKPDGAGNFVYGIINTIRVHSEELCARYGNPADCLEEAEVCLTMRDNDDNQVKLCLNTVPGDSGDQGPVEKSRLRR
jgi:hypothetical protein